MKQRLTKLIQAKSWLGKLIIPVLLLIFSTLLLAPAAEAASIYSLPKVSAGDSTWVLDPAEVISRANEGKLNNSLKKLAHETGNEVRMVAIRRLGYDENIEILTNELFETWFPTAEEQTNQTLIAIDTLTNNSAIRSGEGVKELLPDETAQSIINQTIGLRLREGNKYNQAFLDASDRLGVILSGQPDPGPPIVQEKINTEGTFTKAEDTDQGSATVWVIGLLVVATIIPMATYFFYVGFSN